VTNYLYRLVSYGFGSVIGDMILLERERYKHNRWILQPQWFLFNKNYVLSLFNRDHRSISFYSRTICYIL